MVEVPAWLRAARSGWSWTGRTRPPWADEPEDGQESVWDYPRPPRLEADTRTVTVALPDGTPLAATTSAIRVLETASPPTFYLPAEAFDAERLVRAEGSSLCEWKGEATWWNVRDTDGGEIERVAWSYDRPFPEFEAIAGWLSVFPARLLCEVDGHRVRPQPGDFYGGWITPEVVGPFKGGPGSSGW